MNNNNEPPANDFLIHALIVLISAYIVCYLTVLRIFLHSSYSLTLFDDICSTFSHNPEYFFDSAKKMFRSHLVEKRKERRENKI